MKKPQFSFRSSTFHVLRSNIDHNTKTACVLILVAVFIIFATSIVQAQNCVPGGPPQLTVTAGPGFREVTQSWTGVSGSSGYYTVHGSPDGGATWGVVQWSVVEGQQVNLTVGVWGYNAPLGTFKT
jgi:hypothetical protein